MSLVPSTTDDATETVNKISPMHCSNEDANCTHTNVIRRLTATNQRKAQLEDTMRRWIDRSGGGSLEVHHKQPRAGDGGTPFYMNSPSPRYLETSTRSFSASSSPPRENIAAAVTAPVDVVDVFSSMALPSTAAHARGGGGCPMSSSLSSLPAFTAPPSFSSSLSCDDSGLSRSLVDDIEQRLQCFFDQSLSDTIHTDGIHKPVMVNPLLRL